MSRLVWILGVSLLFAVRAAAQTPAPQPAPCSEPQKQQLAFWVGDWQLSWKGQDGSQKSGSNKIEWTLGDCVIQENFSNAEGTYLGKSWSVYDAGLGKWRQTWVDSGGGYLDFVGEFKDGKMVLQGESVQQGKPQLGRMTFHDISKDKFDWDWEISNDAGKTWKTAWNIHYTRK